MTRTALGWNQELGKRSRCPMRMAEAQSVEPLRCVSRSLRSFNRSQSSSMKCMHSSLGWRWHHSVWQHLWGYLTSQFCQNASSFVTQAVKTPLLQVKGEKSFCNLNTGSQHSSHHLVHTWICMCIFSKFFFSYCWVPFVSDAVSFILCTFDEMAVIFPHILLLLPLCFVLPTFVSFSFICYFF